ncbi:MAG: mechanosensitive ion channel family protein, partial [Thermoplasmata archaeon]|nr:mechanosensitive ion channel family protein [Thermoplasmata archaeon]
MAKVLGVFDNPLPAPLNNNYGVFILDLIIWTVIIIGIYLVIEAVLKRWAKKTKTELDDIIFGIIHFPVIALLILYAFITSLRAFDASEIPAWLFALVDDVYFIALVIIGLFLVYRVFKNVVIYYGKIYAKKTKTDIDDVIIPLAEKLGVVIIFVVAIALLLGYLGIDLTMLAVGSIVISMVIAFALQDTLSNFFSGLYLLTDRPFKDGDLIELESGDICRVAHIGMR